MFSNSVIIVSTDGIEEYSDERIATYRICFLDCSEDIIESHLPLDGRPVRNNNVVQNVCYPKGFKVIKELDVNSIDFVNGYKAVMTGNKEYGFVRESDHKLLPYRYDYATDFNKYGFAMACKDGEVSWINKDFSFLNKDGNMQNDDNFLDNGWEVVESFSDSEIPLSRIEGHSESFYVPVNVFMDTSGKLKSFELFDGNSLYKFSKKYFEDSKPFDPDGHAIAIEAGECYVLFDKGYYILVNDLLDASISDGFLDRLEDVADRNKIVKVYENDTKRNH